MGHSIASHFLKQALMSERLQETFLSPFPNLWINQTEGKLLTHQFNLRNASEGIIIKVKESWARYRTSTEMNLSSLLIMLSDILHYQSTVYAFVE